VKSVYINFGLDQFHHIGEDAVLVANGDNKNSSIHEMVWKNKNLANGPSATFHVVFVTVYH